MSIPLYLWLKDDGGVDIKGDVNIKGRERSIEVTGLYHDVFIPTDEHSGKLTGTRIHGAFCFDKQIDASSPWLYQAASSGKMLNSAEFKWYRINHNGWEEEYFNVFLEGVTVLGVTPIMYDIKMAYGEKRPHLEYVELRYQRITWKYLDGNIIHSDSWNERTIA